MLLVAVFEGGSRRRPVSGRRQNIVPCGGRLVSATSVLFAWTVAGFSLVILGAGMGAQSASDGPLRVRSFQPVEPLSRAGRPAPLMAVIENLSDADVAAEVSISLPARLRLVEGQRRLRVNIEAKDETRLTWTVEARTATECRLGVEARVADAPPARESLVMRFLEPMPMRKLSYIPEPEPVRTSVAVGAHNCPLWEADKPEMWANVVKHPERTPALGFYDQANPEVADWETKWAVEHGISFFLYCWYRAGEGEPVKMRFASAIHDALFRSRFVGKMKFAIMWENQARGIAGVADEKDLLQNLLPFWLENYFRHPSYLIMDNKPLLFIYRPEFLIQDLGGVEKVRQAFDKMRQACRQAGFDGLYILGEYRGLDPNHLTLMKNLGLDYTFAYCWHVPNSPTPEQAIAAQISYITRTQELGILPQVVTVSQAWSGWHDEGSIWKIPPREFEDLLRWAKEFIAGLPPDQLSSRMLLLDNWNEWGEGHYIAPYREYGFGYLDAVRNVFALPPLPRHVDLIPEDIGLGPYDMAYRKWAEEQDKARRLTRRRVLKDGAEEPGLVAWWAFDDPADSAVALDYSGNRLGAVLKGARLVPDLEGNALLCEGGAAVVWNSPALSLTDAISIECWAKTDVAGQDNRWMVNRIFGGGVDTGYRLGVLHGRPCFEIPVTPWSHHLEAEVEMPTGRWVHLVGTFDGQVMRIYVDGEERGRMDRPGPIKPNEFHLCLGNFEVGHAAHFIGLLDEVKLYNRALSAEEIRAHYSRLAAGAGR